MTVGNLKGFQRSAQGILPLTKQHRTKGNTQLQSNIINEINNISESLDIIKDTLFDGVDELSRIESELNEIKKKQGVLEMKGAKNNSKR